MDWSPYFKFTEAVILIIVASISFYKIVQRANAGISQSSRWMLLALWIFMIAVLIYFMFTGDELIKTISISVLAGVTILAITVNLSLMVMSRFGKSWSILEKIIIVPSITIGFVLVLFVLLSMLDHILAI